MTYVITGVNHTTLGVTLRERLFVPAESVTNLLENIRKLPGVAEALLLSTCNRTELHAIVDGGHRLADLQQTLLESLRAPELPQKAWYHATGEKAVRHLFRVTSGLDSLLLGETQVFGQVKDAFERAFALGTTGRLLNQCVHRAFFVAKRVRTETGIGMGSLSLASIAVELIEESICARHPRTLIILGAGKMGEAAARSFREREMGNVVVVSRTKNKAQELAKKMNAEATEFSALEKYLPLADAIITSSASTKPLLTRTIVKRARNGSNAPLVIVDLGVPRNVEPGVGKLAGVLLSTIDDLKEIADRSRVKRRKEARRAETIVAEEAKRTHRELLESNGALTIAALMQKCEAIRKKEVERALSHMQHMKAEEQNIVDACTASIVQKILHDPITVLKKDEAIANILQRAFRIA